MCGWVCHTPIHTPFTHPHALFRRLTLLTSRSVKTERPEALIMGKGSLPQSKRYTMTPRDQRSTW